MVVKRGKYVVELLTILSNGPQTAKQIMKSGFSMNQDYLDRTIGLLIDSREVISTDQGFKLADGVTVSNPNRKPVEPRQSFRLNIVPDRLESPPTIKPAPSREVKELGSAIFDPEIAKPGTLGNGSRKIAGKLDREPYLEKIIQWAHLSDYVCWQEAVDAYVKTHAAKYKIELVKDHHDHLAFWSE
jgi:hypothetical protein